jgi:uncharacterized protein YegL
MPLLSDNDNDGAVKVAAYNFSNINVNNLGADSYTLCGIILDHSGSVSGFAKDIETCVQNVIKGCQKSPRADNMLIRMLKFNSGVEQVHDFKLLNDCAPATYNNILNPGGCTSLFDASVDIIESVANAGKELKEQEYKVNGIVTIITDGCDVGSEHTLNSVKKAIEKARKNECLESILVILIGVNITDTEVSTRLKEFETTGGVDQYVEINKADPNTFAKIAGFIVSSFSSQSQSLGSGTASQPITF